MRGPALAIAVVAVLLAAGCTSDDGSADGPAPILPGTRAASADVAGRDHAELELVSGVTAVSVRTADLGGALYRIWTPDGARQTPDAQPDGDVVRVSLRDSGGQGALRPADRVELTRAWPIRMTGGASTFDLHLPAGVPAQTRMTGGAGQVSLDGTVHTGIGGGAVLATSGWATATDRYQVDAVAGVSALTLDRY